jgi:hypothetical protein
MFSAPPRFVVRIFGAKADAKNRRICVVSGDDAVIHVHTVVIETLAHSPNKQNR